MSAATDIYGLPNIVQPKTTDGLIGRVKTLAGLTIQEWTFLAVSTAALLGTAGLTLERLVEYSANNRTSPDFTFSLLVLVNAVFCLVYVYNGVLRERQFELYAFVAAYVVVLLYCIFEYCFNESNRSDIKLARLIAGCALAPFTIGLALHVANAFGWLEFRIIGASKILQEMYRQTCIFSSILMFDLQATISIIILALHRGSDIRVLEIVTISVGIPFSLLWAAAGWYAVRKELRRVAIAFGMLSILQPCYIIYRITMDYKDLYPNGIQNVDPDPDKDILILYSTLAAGALGLLVRIVLVCELIAVFKNFGFGLKERAFPEANEATSLLSGRPTLARR